MKQIIYILKMTNHLADALVIILAAIFAAPFDQILSYILVGMSIFYVAIRTKREIQEHHFNKVWRAIKSLFRKRNKYGEE